MLRVAVQPISNQTLAVTLARQAAQIALRQIGGAIYFDLRLGASTSIVRMRICRDRQRLLLDVQYSGFIGDFAFVDTQGTADPQFAGLGTRWRLYYLGAGE